MTRLLPAHMEAARKAKGLGKRQLAGLVGYRNISKFCRRWQSLQESGACDIRLLTKLAAILEVPEETVRELAGEDRRRYVAEWEAWASEPTEPYMVVRLIPAVYKSEKLPESARTLQQAEEHAAATARKWDRSVCLVWSRRLSIYFDNQGKAYCRAEATPDRNVVPYMRIGNKYFLMGGS